MKSLIRVLESQLDSSQPMLGCEVGVWKGVTSRALLTKFPSLGLVMVDRYQAYADDEGSFRLGGATNEDFQGAMNEAIKNTAEFANRRFLMVADSVHAAYLLKDKLFDFVLVDALHTEKAVIEDSICFFPRVKREGLFCWHDYSHHRAFRRHSPVNKAVDKFCKSLGYEVQTEPRLLAWIKKR